MKKILSVLAVLGMVAIAGNQCANAAFTWSSLNPANWFGNRCNKCETPKPDCGCPVQKVTNPCPCTTGAAAPCNPCEKTINPAPCDACDKLQQHMQNR